MIEGRRMNASAPSVGRLRPRAEALGIDLLAALTHPEDSGVTPKMLPTYLAEPLEGVWEISIVLENLPKLLTRAQQVIEQQGLALTSVQSFTPLGGSRTSFRCLARPSASTSKEGTLSAVLAIPGVIGTNIEENQGKFLVASGFPLVGLNGVRLAAITAPHFARLFADLQDVLGSGGSFLLYRQGLLLGERTWADYLERIGRPYALQEWGYVLRLYETMGWGRVELVSAYHLGGVAEVRVWDNFECLERSAAHPVCQFVRGHIAGAFSALWQQPVDCVEEKCSAEGHPACTYLIAIRSPGVRPAPAAEEYVARNPVVPSTLNEGTAGAPGSPAPEPEGDGAPSV